MEFFTPEIKAKRLSFATEQLNSKWENVLFSTFGIVKNISVWVAVNKSASSLIAVSRLKMNPNRYLEILNNILLPLLNKNLNMIFVQVNQIDFY